MYTDNPLQQEEESKSGRRGETDIRKKMLGFDPIFSQTIFKRDTIKHDVTQGTVGTMNLSLNNPRVLDQTSFIGDLTELEEGLESQAGQTENTQ